MKATCSCGNGKPVLARGMCKPCYDRQWQKAHAPQIAERKRRYRQRNRKRIAAEDKARYEKNREARCATMRAYKQRTKKEFAVSDEHLARQTLMARL